MPVPNLPQFSGFELVGQGGGADVYKAVRVSTGGEVAIKVFLPTVDIATIARRANREVGALVSLKGHPNVVQIEEVLQLDDGVCVVMEYVSGGSLAERIKATPSGLDPAVVADVGRQIASALAAAHEKGILHRDVKPQNVLFGSYGVAKLCDFGIATLVSSGQAARTSAISIRYASPEELDGASLSAATDVYSLGATLLHALIGRPADLTERLGGIGDLVQEVPEPLRGVIVQCMLLDPAQRDTAAQVAATLAPDSATASSLPSPFPAPSTSSTAADRPDTTKRPADGRRALEGGTMAIVVDRPPPSSPAPARREAWFRRPITFAVLGAIAILAGLAIWLIVGGEDDDEPDAVPSTIVSSMPSAGAPAASSPETAEEPGITEPASVLTSPAPATTATSTEPPSTVIETVPGPVANQFGDVVGQPVTSPAGPAGAFALGVQTSVDPELIAVPHSSAYYYALWSNLVGRAVAGAPVVAVDGGYELQFSVGRATITDLSAPTGRVDTVTEIVDGVATDVSTAITSSGVCVPFLDPATEPCAAGFAGSQFVADSTSIGARLFNLATVRLDPNRDTLLMYIDVPDATVLSASGPLLDRVSIDPRTSIMAVSYGSQPPAGTVIDMTVTFTDQRVATFRFAVS